MLHPAHVHSTPQKAISKARAKLTQSDALDIYNCKGSVTSAAALSKLYGVCEKAVRDIWTGRTWLKETWHLDDSRPYQAKKIGRPFGRKDAQPRKPRGFRPLTTDKSIGIPSESRWTYKEPIFSMTKSEGPNVRIKVINEVPTSGWFWRDQSIDDLLHEKALCGFDTAFEDPFGPDWAAALCSLHQSTRK